MEYLYNCKGNLDAYHTGFSVLYPYIILQQFICCAHIQLLYQDTLALTTAQHFPLLANDAHNILRTFGTMNVFGS